MDDLISRQAVIETTVKKNSVWNTITNASGDNLEQIINSIPAADAVEVIRCKDCKYQEKFFHEDKRRKEGGYYICGCELVDGYSHVCLDHEFCSRAERR